MRPKRNTQDFVGGALGALGWLGEEYGMQQKLFVIVRCRSPHAQIVNALIRLSITIFCCSSSVSLRALVHFTVSSN